MVVTDVERWVWRTESSIDAAGGCWKDLAQGDLEAGGRGGIELVKIGADETAVKGGCYIVGVALDL